MSVKLDSRIVQVQARVNSRLTQIVNKAIHDVKAQAQANTPVDTGFLKNSAFAEMEDEAQGVVGYTAEYAPMVELGHATQSGGYVPGVHMLEGAVGIVFPAFAQAVGQVIEG